MSLIKTEFSFEKRKMEANRMLALHKNRIPFIIIHSDITLTKYKYLVPKELNIIVFLRIIAHHNNPYNSVYILINNTLIPSHETFDNIYNTHKETDGFLYASIHAENTFG